MKTSESKFIKNKLQVGMKCFNSKSIIVNESYWSKNTKALFVIVSAFEIDQSLLVGDKLDTANQIKPNQIKPKKHIFSIKGFDLKAGNHCCL